MNMTTLYDTAFLGGVHRRVDDAEMIHTPLIPRVIYSGLYNYGCWRSVSATF
jgi:hypothetical protein